MTCEMHAKITNVSNREELLTILAAVDISVPSREQGRRSFHRERWTICRLLSTLAVNSHLKYPLSLSRTERPDFSLICNLVTIGIEVTEAANRDYSKFLSIAEREFSGESWDIGHFRYGSPPMITKRMREILKSKKITSDGWSGDSAEREWSLFVKDRIYDKNESISKPGFTIFEENWLSIYSNLPIPSLDYTKSIAYLNEEISNMWDKNSSFNLVFVDCGSTIFRLSKASWTAWTVHNLWQSRHQPI